jgi:general secretion pathway protein G
MKRRAVGFTLIELLVTLTLVGIAAAAVLPLATVMETRAKETELKRALRTVRQALDSYKAAADSGMIDKATGSSGYPPSLKILATGVPKSASMGFNKLPMIFLRNIPRDPFNEDKSTAPEDTWNIRFYGVGASSLESSKEVFDISSKSDKLAMNGTKYSDW